MKSYIKKNIMIYILLIVFIFMIINSNIVINSVLLAIDIWKNNVFPALFPFFILSDLLINYGLIEYLGLVFEKPMKLLFKFDKPSIFIFFMSMVTGFPSSSKYITRLLNENIIDLDTANRMITCSHFSNPLFLFGTIKMLLNDIKACLIILISHYLGNVILAILTRNTVYIKEKVYKIKRQSFSDCLSESIVKNTNTLLFILGSIIIFLVIGNIINNYIGTNTLFSNIISGLLEITQGIKNISLMTFNIKIKSIITTFFISFGGLCIHIQTIGIISGTSIKYSNFFKARFLHGFISMLLACIFNLLV